MIDWKQQFNNDDIFFITPDVKRGLGFAGILPKYHIVCCDFDPIIPIIRSQGANIFCLEENGIGDISKVRNSGKILELPQVIRYIRSNAINNPKIMYFKPSVKLDDLITKNGFIPIGNNAEINDLFEDKVKFASFAQRENLKDYLVQFSLGILGELKYEKLSQSLGDLLVVQFGHGWAGKTTFIIKNKKDFELLAQKFPFTRVKVSKYVRGFAVLNNGCIYKDKVLVGPTAVQIDGISILSQNPQMTCGRQWPAKFLSQSQEKEITDISNKVGIAMSRSGYGGFLGFDFLVEESTGRVYLSEANARMTASSAFYTLLEIGEEKIPLLSFHLAQFLGKDLSKERYESSILTGSQIIVRNPLRTQVFSQDEFGVYKYDGSKIASIGKSYHPENLAENEFIFMERKIVDKENVEEYGRVETENEVLEKPGKLKGWIQDLLG